MPWAERLGCHAVNHRNLSGLTAQSLSEPEIAVKNQSMNELTGDRLISKREAAGILGVSIRTVERAISQGSISIRKIRGCVRLLLSEILLFGGIQQPQRQ
jgi:DNA-binding transcriptional MocR family regulator